MSRPRTKSAPIRSVSSTSFRRTRMDSPTFEVTPVPQQNFFDHDMEEDIWDPMFTRNLRKSSAAFEAMPFIPDSTVETIGGAYVDEERSIRQDWKTDNKPRAAGDITDAPPSSHTSLSLSSFSQKDLEHIKILEKRMEELEVSRWQAPSIPDTINRLLLRKTCSLSWYKSMDQKYALLDAAIETFEGNCIMTIILFIRKTVDPSIFLNILSKRPVACQHYANFLKKLKNWKDLRSLYRRLNNYDSLAYFAIEECHASDLDKDEKIRRIKSCPIQFKHLQLLNSEDLQHVEEYSRLMHAQVKIEDATGHGGAKIVREDGVLFLPLTSTLLYCCRSKGHVAGDPENLRKVFNIPERQYFQMSLLALACSKNWGGISAMLTSKGVMGFGKKKKSPIGFERVVRLLGQDCSRAPDNVLKQYLDEIDDLEARYQLGMEVAMYDTCLEALKGLKDRDRVQAFINYVPPVKHYEYRAKIDKILSNSQLKWK